MPHVRTARSSDLAGSNWTGKEFAHCQRVQVLDTLKRKTAVDSAILRVS
jgi:hypothetical protein